MIKEQTTGKTTINAQPRLHQHAGELQHYGTVSHQLPLELEGPVRLEMTEQLNQLLADTMTLRDLYKKSHWQVAGPTFYQLHLLYDKHHGEQDELVDAIAERIQLLGGVSLAMAPMLRRPRRSNDLLADERRFPFNFPGCWRLTRLLSVNVVRSPDELPHWGMTARTTLS